MAQTRTGSFPIGFRANCPWMRTLPDAIAFAKENDFSAIDPLSGTPDDVRLIKDAGLSVGSFDLPQPWTKLCHTDEATRKQAAEQMAEQVSGLAKAGVKWFFCVVIPDDHAAPRKDNLDLAAHGYGLLCEHIKDLGVKIVLEGYPGGPPHVSSLACTPADYRLFFDAVASDVLGVNYDPSHLVRMGIDPLRFIQEFAPRIFHVHAKDTELFDDKLYDHGNLQPATVEQSHGFGGHVWRYTIPGHGCIRWTRLFTELKERGYDGVVSIELEDENFAGSPEATQRGLLASRDFLVHA